MTQKPELGTCPTCGSPSPFARYCLQPHHKGGSHSGTLTQADCEWCNDPFHKGQALPPSQQQVSGRSESAGLEQKKVEKPHPASLTTHSLSNERPESRPPSQEVVCKHECGFDGVHQICQCVNCGHEWPNKEFHGGESGAGTMRDNDWRKRAVGVCPFAKRFGQDWITHDTDSCVVCHHAILLARQEVNAALEKAAEIARHFANDELTKKEWPPHGLVVRKCRFDNGLVGVTGDNIASAIERMKEE